MTHEITLSYYEYGRGPLGFTWSGRIDSKTRTKAALWGYIQEIIDQKRIEAEAKK
jgi:hypothetical protein